MNYLATSENQTIADTVLSMTNGTGITHNFSDTYFPRLFTGEFFYNTGLRPQGDCTSGRQPINVKISEPMPDLGDVHQWLRFGDTLWLSPGADFEKIPLEQRLNGQQSDDFGNGYYQFRFDNLCDGYQRIRLHGSRFCSIVDRYSSVRDFDALDY